MKAVRTYRLLALLLVALMLVGCAKSEPNDMGSHIQGGAGGEGIYDNNTAGNTVMPQTSQKLIYTVTIDAETDDLDTLLADLDAKLAQLGGYVQSKTIQAGSTSSTHSTRYATMTLRIPVAHFRSFVSHVEGATNILSSSETAEDVTLQYVDIESRINALKTQEKRLLELLSKANSLDDLLLLESKLSDVRQELEKVESQRKVLDNQIAYSTVNLNITEVVEFTTAQDSPSVWTRISTGFVNSLKGVWTIVTELFIFFIVALPYLAIPAVIVILVLVSGRKHRRTHPKHPSAPPEPKEDT